MHKEASDELSVRFKVMVLELAKIDSITKICKEFNVPRSTFYRWKNRYEQEGLSGLYRKKPVAYSHPRKTSS